jgi:hypothetical protein
LTIPYYDPFGAFGIIIVIMIIVLTSCILQIVISVWVYKDAKKRDMDPTMWLAITLLAGCIGCIIYLVVRDPIASENVPISKEIPFESDSNQKDKATSEKSIFCGNCGSAIPTGAKFCPSCGNPV